MKTATPPAAAGTPADQATSVEPGELDALEARATAEAAVPDPNAPKPEEPAYTTEELLRDIGGPAFAIMAPNWHIHDSEKLPQLAKAYGAVIDKYFPDFQMAFGPEIACALVTITVFGPPVLLKIPPHLPKPKPAPAAEEAAHAGAD
mgnify:CR=1 FL=1